MTSTRNSGGLAALRSAIRRARFTDEESLVAALLDAAPYDEEVAGQIEDDAAALVRSVRADRAGRTVLDRFLAEYGLSNQEGVALMCLAEALLRIPDSRTAERLIADKLGAGAWSSHIGHSDDLLVNASTWALMLTGRVVALDRAFASDPLEWMRRLAKRLGEPVIQGALRQAMHILGAEFVLGRTIGEALSRSASPGPYSYDMLGEGARDAQAAQRYLEAYACAIASLAKAEPAPLPPKHPDFDRGPDAGVGLSAPAETSPSGRSMKTPRSGLRTGAEASVSVKLSALHPRYEFAQRERVHRELYLRLKSLAENARTVGIALTVDAEEADRLDLSLELVERLAMDDDLSDWPGLGMAVQAYGKRALPVIDWLAALARDSGRRIPVRLVKGAYWDAEIKHAQTFGHHDFPVFTRKANTDLCYLVCARRMLEHPRELAAQFATHNAHTVAAVMALAGPFRDFEFQRLHGMGETLYRAAAAHYPDLPPVRVYAPVGSHEDLLAYLVRRLLENGANASFVNRVLNERLPPETLVADPLRQVRATSPAAHPGIRAPRELFGDRRVNSAGLDLTDAENVGGLQRHCEALTGSPIHAAPIVAAAAVGSSGAASRLSGGAPGAAGHAASDVPANAVEGARRAIRNPARHEELVGYCIDAGPADVERTVEHAAHAQPAWNDAGAAQRAGTLETAADSLEAALERFVALLVKEAGKTLPDAVAEVREAVDFCRYYAAEARRLTAEPAALPGPTGESNRLSLHGRGVFACISPWNFPLAIFVGQVGAALVTGNAVVAKPAEETPLIAFETVRLLHAAGVPAGVLQLLTGDGTVGAALVSHPGIAGVAFTGSTQTARRINRALAERDAPIAPLIAETGGQNVMFVDSTALPEQVTDDVIQSAFGSAGQRCSALRVLYLQDDIADRTLGMIKGAMDELRVGDPARLETDVGPVISRTAAAALEKHVARLAAEGASRHTAQLTAECRNGTFVAPELLEIETIRQLDGEQFGPILHVVRFAGREIESAVSEAMSTGYGLTLGLHSRIEGRAERLFEMVSVGNVYVNRNMVGAVVGSQPFGGQGLSGTGPKAGGPHYLLRFTTEKVLTLNTAAIGGNMELLSLDDG